MRSNIILSVCTPGLPTVSRARSYQRTATVGVESGELSLADVPLLEEVELVRLDLPDHQLEPLLERGMLPGCRLCPVRLSPFGDPIVMLDGTLLALRREMAGCLCVRRAGPDVD